MYKIGFISKLLNLSTQAIRLYEKKGLLTPSYVDEDTGYRFYSDQDIDTLWNIQLLRGYGFSIKDIKNMDGYAIAEIQNSLNQRKQILEDRIRQDTITLTSLTKRIESLSQLQNANLVEGTYIEFPDRVGQAVPATDNRNTIEHTKMVNQFHVEDDLHTDIAYQPARLLELNNDFSPQLKYLFALKDNAFTQPHINYRVKKGLFYCKRFVGLAGVNKQYEAMFQVISSDGFKPRGDIIELLLLDTPIVGDNQYVLREIQIPVIKI